MSDNGIAPVDGPRTVIVLGSSRGGTSMVAGTLRLLGLDLGKDLGKEHEDPEFLTHDLDSMIATVRRRNDERLIWGWKVPDSIAFLDDLLPHLRNPLFVVITRNILGVAESWRKRDGLPVVDGLVQASNRYERISYFCRRHRAAYPMLFLSFEKATTDPQAMVDELAAFVGLEPSGDQRAAIDEFVDRSRGYVELDFERTQPNTVAPRVEGPSERTPPAAGLDSWFGHHTGPEEESRFPVTETLFDRLPRSIVEEVRAAHADAGGGRLPGVRPLFRRQILRLVAVHRPDVLDDTVGMEPLNPGPEASAGDLYTADTVIGALVGAGWRPEGRLAIVGAREGLMRPIAAALPEVSVEGVSAGTGTEAAYDAVVDTNFGAGDERVLSGRLAALRALTRPHGFAVVIAPGVAAVRRAVATGEMEPSQSEALLADLLTGGFAESDEISYTTPSWMLLACRGRWGIKTWMVGRQRRADDVYVLDALPEA